MSGVRLIPNEKLLNLNTKSLYDLYKQYENEINDNGRGNSGGSQPHAAMAEPLMREAMPIDIDIDPYLKDLFN